MSVSLDDILAIIFQYYFPFLRIGAMFMVMPIIGSRLVNSKTRMFIAVLVTLAAAPLIEVHADPRFDLQTLVYSVREIAIGLAVGFVFTIFFQVFALAGQLMAMKMGLGFAMMNDPANGVQTTVVSQFFLMLTTLVFICSDGHLFLISLIVDSFQVLPAGLKTINPDSFLYVARLGGWMFATALVYSLPVLTSLLFVNISFGIMSRAAPQLNIFAIGFPFTLTCGLLLIWLGLINFIDAFERVGAQAFDIAHELLGAF